MPVDIIKGAPIPERANNGGRPSIWPWEQMEVGDSFIMDKPRSKARPQAYRAGSRYGFKFTTRKIDANTTQIWRIE